MRKQIFVLLCLMGLLAGCAPVSLRSPGRQAAPFTWLVPTSLPPVRLTSTLSPTLLLPKSGKTSGPLPSPAPARATSSAPTPSGESVSLPSPDGRWTAILNLDAGSLELQDAQGVKRTVFPVAGEAGGQVLLGTWSPESSRLLFWSGPSSPSIQADGLPLWSLEAATGRATRLAETTLVNPAYQSWSPVSLRSPGRPDGLALAFTNGGYRSAQVGKWLSLYEVASGRVTTLVPETELVSGQVAWSPAENIIAFAAVDASRTGEAWADWMDWENPAIQARRIYLLDVRSGQYWRLNTTEAYQDAPRWSADGKRLYYVQMDGDEAVVMAADPSSREAPVSLRSTGRQPLADCWVPRPDRAGYYGQVDWTTLYGNCPEVKPFSGQTGATITGQVIAGYGDHRPVAGLPLRIRQKGEDSWDTYTDGNGTFTLTNLPLGRVDIDDGHLSFQVTIDSPAQSLDLGRLKYPLIHPPDYYWWQAAPLADLSQLLGEGKPVDFKVCTTDTGWVRPDLNMQREKVYAQPPFNQLDEKRFEKFGQIAVLYDTIDIAQQSFPAGLNPDELGADWLYLTGLWTAANKPLSNSDCSYAAKDLQSLFDRSQLEIWLFGYQATRVQELDKEEAEVAESAFCDPNERSCTVRPGYHYAVQVVPAGGFQIIRFASKQDVLVIHIINSGREILALP